MVKIAPINNNRNFIHN